MSFSISLSEAYGPLKSVLPSEARYSILDPYQKVCAVCVPVCVSVTTITLDDISQSSINVRVAVAGTHSTSLARVSPKNEPYRLMGSQEADTRSSMLSLRAKFFRGVSYATESAHISNYQTINFTRDSSLTVLSRTSLRLTGAANIILSA